jgi:hypothetical protein
LEKNRFINLKKDIKPIQYQLSNLSETKPAKHDGKIQVKISRDCPFKLLRSCFEFIEIFEFQANFHAVQMLQIDFFCKSEYISFRYVKGTVSPD